MSDNEDDEYEGGYNPWAEVMADDDGTAADGDAVDAAARGQRFETSRDNLIVMIDARQNMLQRNGTDGKADSGPTFLTCALTFAINIMKAKCQYDKGGKVAVMLVGTANSNCRNRPNIFLLNDLSEPSVMKIKEMGLYAVDQSNNSSSSSSHRGAGAASSASQLHPHLAAKVGGFLPARDRLPLADAIIEASSIFTQKNLRAQDTKRLWMFTNDDSPPILDVAGLLTRAGDAAASRIYMQLWPLQNAHLAETEGKGFKVAENTFWNDLLLAGAAEDEGGIDGEGRGRKLRAHGDEDRIVAQEGDDGGDDEDEEAASSSSSSSAADGSKKSKRPTGRFGDYVDPFDGNANTEAANQELRKRIFPKRVYARLCFDLLPNVTISVGLYNTILQAKRPSAKTVETGTDKPLIAARKTLITATGAEVQKNELQTYFEVGGKKVFFTEQEIRDLKSVTTTGKGLELLCFKPRSSLRGIDNVGHPMMLYPREKELVGSTSTFRALHNRMAVRDVVAIVRMQMRDGTEPRIMALFPQLEIRQGDDDPDDVEEAADDDDEDAIRARAAAAAKKKLSNDTPQLTPAGLVMVQLPYLDDIRSIRAEGMAMQSASNEEVSAASELVDSLVNTAYRAHFPKASNPSLAKFWAVLERRALQTEANSTTLDENWAAGVNGDDLGEPAVAAMQEGAGEAINAFRDTLGLSADGKLPTAAQSKAKTAAAAAASTTGSRGGGGGAIKAAAAKKPAAKRAKKDDDEDAEAGDGEEPDQATVLAQWRKSLAQGKVAGNTMDTLKNFLRMFNLRVGGKKDELVARVTEYLQSLPEGDGAEGGDGASGSASSKPKAKAKAAPASASRPKRAAASRSTSLQMEPLDEEDEDEEEEERAPRKGPVAGKKRKRPYTGHGSDVSVSSDDEGEAEFSADDDD